MYRLCTKSIKLQGQTMIERSLSIFRRAAAVGNFMKVAVMTGRGGLTNG